MGFKVQNGQVSTDSRPISTDGQPGPMKVLKNIVKGGLGSLSGSKSPVTKKPTISTDSQPGPMKVLGGIVKGQVSNAITNGKALLSARADNKRAGEYDSIRQKLQKARKVPSSVLYTSNEKDPAFRAKVQGMSAADKYKDLQAGK